MPEKTSPAKPARARPARKTDDATVDTSAPEGERIAKVLSRAGVSSRREAERLIEAGEVKVNGKLVTSPALNVGPRDKITVSGQPVGAPEPARLWLYYKPEGLVTSASDEKGRETVFDHLPEDMPRVMSVGRLDLNSEGLLLLTNDGALKRQLELPSTGWLRKYRVRVKGNPTDPELEPLRRGITVDGERFQPMEVILDRHQGANAWLTVGLREGKNREIRRAMTEIGLTVNRLIRISYGPFRLNELKPGEVEEVRARVLRDQLGALLPDAPEGAERPTARSATRKPAAKDASASRAKPGPKVTRSSGSGRDRDEEPSRARATRAPRERSSDPAPGKVTTSAGRAGLKSLSQSWSKATTRAEGSTKPIRGRSADNDGPDPKSTRRSTTRPVEAEGRKSGPAFRSRAEASGQDRSGASTRPRSASADSSGGKSGSTSGKTFRSRPGAGSPPRSGDPSRGTRNGPKRGK